MNYANLIQNITENIKTNGSQAITAQVLQDVLVGMVGELGQSGALLGGVIDTSFVPDPTNDAQVFYLAESPGTYTNFNGLVVGAGEVAFFYFDGNAWAKSSVDVLAVVNNLNSTATDKALSAAMGKQIGDNISQLGQDVTDLEQEVNGTDKSVDVDFAIAIGPVDYSKSVDIKAGVYNITVDDPNNALPQYTRIYLNGTSVGYLKSLTNPVTIANDVTTLGLYYNGQATTSGNITIHFEDTQSSPSLDERISSLEETSEDMSEDVNSLKTEVYGEVKMEWYQGNLYGQTGKFSPGNTRVINLEPLPLPIKVKSNSTIYVAFILRFKDGKSPETGGVLNTDWISESVSQAKTIIITENNEFPNTYITLRKPNSSDPVSVSEVENDITLEYTDALVQRVDELEKDGLAESVNYKVDAIPSDLFDQSEFIIGDNWHGNIDTSVKYRVSMASIHTAGRDLYLSVLDGYRFSLDFFVNGAFSSGVSYRQSPYKIPQGTEYVLKIAKYPEDTSLEADLGLFVSQVRIQSEFQQTLLGKGFVEYYGQRVSPLKMQKDYQCDENVLISQTMPSDGNNVNKDAAGLVVYGNRIFSFNNGATCSVFALDTLELLQVASLPWSAHNNNAQPTPYFYDSADTYPLFLVSRGDYAGQGEQKFYFVRVVESSGSFTFTIVKEVSYSGFLGAEYNCSWFANYEKGELYCYSYPNGGWSVAENNPNILHKFDFPSLDNYDPVTLTGADVKETITLQDHWITQSGLYHNGKIFFQVEGDPTWDLTINGQTFDKSLGLHWLFVINAESGYIESYVPLYSAIEQEGMCIYDGELYMSEKYTTATVGNICYRLVKYKF